MTVKEAREYLGLKENDVIYREGLEAIKNSFSRLAETTVSSIERSEAIRGIQACEILIKEAI